MNSTDLDAAARDAAMAFARRLAPAWQAVLGSEFLGLYLIGSLAHGGFSRRYSDIDAAVVTETALSSHTLESLRRQATAMSDEWGPKVSLFWTDRQFGVGRFPPLDRLDYLDRPVVLAERERVTPAPPALEEIRDYLRGAPFANWANTRARIRQRRRARCQGPQGLSAGAAVPGAALLQLRDRPHDLERRRGGVSARTEPRPDSISTRSNGRCNAATPPPIPILCSICATACPRRSTPARRYWRT